MDADGLFLEDKRQPVAENDIPDLLKRWKERNSEQDTDRTKKAFFVPKAKIAANGYDLSINRYKETEYAEVNYESPKAILQKMRSLDDEIRADLDTRRYYSVAPTCLLENNYEHLLLSDKLWRSTPDYNIANTKYSKFLLTDSAYRRLITQKATSLAAFIRPLSWGVSLRYGSLCPEIIAIEFTSERVASTQRAAARKVAFR